MPSVERLIDVQLVTVVEMEPALFATAARERPGGSIAEMPQAWDAYWRGALADAGIVDVEPIETGSWCVPTGVLTESNLTIFLRSFTSDLEEWGMPSSWDDPDEITGLPGGLCLVDAAFGVVVHPMCCSDLGTIAQWRDAAAHRESDWLQLWIGHPERYVRYQAPRLQISEPHEGIDVSDPVARWTVSPEALTAGLEKAGAELQRLSDAIIPILHEWGCPTNTVTAIAEKFAGVRSNWG